MLDLPTPTALRVHTSELGDVTCHGITLMCYLPQMSYWFSQFVNLFQGRNKTGTVIEICRLFVQAATREKATQKEVERLQTAIRNLLDEAGQRTKIEVGV